MQADAFRMQGQVRVAENPVALTVSLLLLLIREYAVTISLLPPAHVTTTLELPGFRIVRTLGLARGLTVRSRSVVGNIGAAIQSLFGGNITLYTELCEQARQEAFALMCQHAARLGANAIVGARFDATEVAPGITEVLAYGTAAVVDPLSR